MVSEKSGNFIIFILLNSSPGNLSVFVEFQYWLYFEPIETGKC